MTAFKQILCFCIISLLAGQLPVAAQYYPLMPEISEQEGPRLKQAAIQKKDDIHKLRALENLSWMYLQKPSKWKADLTTSMKYAHQALKLSERLGATAIRDSILITLAELYARTGDHPAASATVQRLRGEARIHAQLILALHYAVAEKGQQADVFIRDAALQMPAVHNRLLELMFKQVSGLVHTELKTGDPEKELLDAVEGLKAISYRKMHYPYLALVVYYYEKGLLDKALYYSQLALKSVEAAGDSAHVGDIYMGHSVVLIYNDNYTAGVEYAYKAIEAYKRHSGILYDLSRPAIFATVTWGLGKLGREREGIRFLLASMRAYPPHNAADSSFFLASIGHMYRGLKKFGQAEPFFLKALAISKRNNESSIYTYRDVSQFYVESGQFNKAKIYLKEVLRLKPERMGVPAQRHVRHLLFLADSATGDYRSAVDHLRALRVLDDYQVRVERDKEVHRLEVLLEAEKREHELREKNQQISLLNQQAAFDKSMLQVERKIRNLVIGVSVLFLVIAVLLFYQYRNKRRMSGLMEQKNVLITQKNGVLERLVNEKEWLLKEVHHRVKNNLHTIFCLLESQASFLSSDARMAVEKSQHRIYAMSLVHQKLYLSEDIKTIDMSLFFPEFLHFLSESFEAGDRIKIRHHVEPIRMSVASAIPIGLIVNEAVTNAIKYAFPGNDAGEISVAFQRKGSSTMLIVADNGIGMAHPDETEHGSLGIQLMKGLAHEMQAKIEFDTSKGTAITVVIPEHPVASTISVTNSSVQ